MNPMPPRTTVLLLGTFLLLAPVLFQGNYSITVFILCVLHAMHAVGLCLLVGHAGQISLGHGGFYGLAAYTSAVCSTRWGFPVEASMLLGVLLTVALAVVLGQPILKLRGHYLAMATLGLGVILSIIFNEAVAITGGPSGFVGIPQLQLAGYVFQDDRSIYALASMLLLAMVWMAANLLGSRGVRALRALHGSEAAAMAMGIDVARTKLAIFVLSVMFSAISGVLYAHYLTFIAPSSFGFLFSVELIVMVVLGGMGSILGSVAGAFFITWLPELLRHFENIELLLFGLILLGCNPLFTGRICWLRKSPLALGAFSPGEWPWVILYSKPSMYRYVLVGYRP
jgi:branched-chain amino acid transport system permease protein